MPQVFVTAFLSVFNGVNLWLNFILFSALHNISFIFPFAFPRPFCYFNMPKSLIHPVAKYNNENKNMKIEPNKRLTKKIFK